MNHLSFVAKDVAGSQAMGKSFDRKSNHQLSPVQLVAQTTFTSSSTSSSSPADLHERNFQLVDKSTLTQQQLSYLLAFEWDPQNISVFIGNELKKILENNKKIQLSDGSFLTSKEVFRKGACQDLAPLSSSNSSPTTPELTAEDFLLSDNEALASAYMTLDISLNKKKEVIRFPNGTVLTSTILRIKFFELIAQDLFKNPSDISDPDDIPPLKPVSAFPDPELPKFTIYIKSQKPQ